MFFFYRDDVQKMRKINDPDNFYASKYKRF